MSTITIRSPDDTLADALRRESQASGESINKLVLEALREKFLQARARRRYSDLDRLAGTWSEEDAAAFSAALADFERVDAGDWQ